MNNVFEEILEAVWTANESGNPSLESIRKRCPIPLEDIDIDALVSRDLVQREGEKITLSIEGERAARAVVRRHRLAVSLFATILDMDVTQREAIACEVEHTLLPEVEEAICILLGHPKSTPDDQIIPAGSCCAANRSHASTVIVNLTQLVPGERGRITHIRHGQHACVQRLAAYGLRPGTVVELRQRSPSYCIQYDGTELAIDDDIAAELYVARYSGATAAIDLGIGRNNGRSNGRGRRARNRQGNVSVLAEREH